MENLKLFALIVAGGSGTRLGQATPKQFIPIGGRPILMHTITAFHEANPTIDISIVLPQRHTNFWKELCKNYNFTISHKIVAGGSTRGESVLNGLKSITEEGLVAIHDGVRPFIGSDIILKSFVTAQEKGSAITTVDLKDSLREITAEGSMAVDRSKFKVVQTPQTFQVSIIKDAYEKVGALNLTDDGAVAEANGVKLELMEGSYNNIKITTPEDLIIAEEILRNR